MAKEQWLFNSSTGNYILNISPNSRIIRDGSGKGCLYLAEFWGDYSLKYPIKGDWCKSLKMAKANLRTLSKVESNQ